MEATNELLLEVGAERIRVADIARRAGLTTGAIYGNFRDRADVLAHARLARYEQIVRDSLARGLRVRASTASDRGPEMHDAVRDLLSAPGQRRHLERLAVIAAAHHDDHLSQELQRLHEQLLAETADHVRQAQANQFIDPELDAYALAAIWHAIPLGLASILPNIKESEVERFVTVWLRLLDAVAPVGGN